jgi:Carboxypeptidase regulatory-like domain
MRRAANDALAVLCNFSPPVLLCCLVIVAVGCGDDPRGAARARPAARATAAGAIDLPTVAYRPVPLTSMGSIAGTVQLDGEVADSAVITTVDKNVCGAAIPDSSIVHRGNALANVVVWLSDVTEGKPLPIERRTEIVNEDCQLVPRVQAVVAGTTVNVRNEDRLAHTTRFVRGGTGDTIARVPLTDDGQVVPNEHIAAKSGMIAVSCAQHSWTRGYIAVLESPYFAISDVSGAFRIDSVPPGKYHLVAWHERGRAQVQQEIEVRAGAESRADLTMRVQ